MKATNRRLLALVGIGLGGLVAAGCGRATAQVPVSHHPAAGVVQIRISLDATRVVAGQELHGEAVVTNTGSTPILLNACSTQDWLMVGLANAQVRYDPVVPDGMCSPPTRLPPGPSRFPITVRTTYQSCAGPEGEPSAQVPACVGDRMPVLPSGTYQTEVDTQGLPSVTPPAPITVTVAD